MSRRLRTVCLTVAIATVRHIVVEAWSPLPCKPLQQQNLRHLEASAAASAFAVTLFGATLFLPIDHAAAADAIPPTNTDTAVMSSGLSAPTPETPQIMFSGNRPNQGPSVRPMAGPRVLPQKGGKSPILQGLIYIDRPNSRPSFADTLVLTAGTVEQPDEVLAGAKFAITQARFPMQFSMYQENIIRGKEEMWSKAKEGDIFVSARVCPEDAKLPCSDKESTYRARGVSKLIRNLPGMDDETIVRTAISLPLK